tara:strand:- start:525 stop:755 length:231 start_codon:yes stop_codon:yes gene_type:complete
MVGILTNETIKQKQQEIEVKALAALLEHGNFYYSNQAQLRLAQIAMPDLIADELEQETLIDNYKQRPKRNYWGEKE